MSDDDLREALKAYVSEVSAEDFDSLPEPSKKVTAVLHHIFSRLLELLPPAGDDAEPPFNVWAFIRDVMNRGAAIHADTISQGRTYEQHSARLDAVARELADIIKPHMKEPKS